LAISANPVADYGHASYGHQGLGHGQPNYGHGQQGFGHGQQGFGHGGFVQPGFGHGGHQGGFQQHGGHGHAQPYGKWNKSYYIGKLYSNPFFISFSIFKAMDTITDMDMDINLK